MYLHAIIQLNFVFILTISQKKNVSYLEYFTTFTKKKLNARTLEF